MAPDVLIHGDTHRSAALRHELPLGIPDPFSYSEIDGRRVAVIASMEAGRVKAAAPGVEVIDPYDLGLDGLIAQGMRWDELEPELCARAAAELGARKVSGSRTPCRWRWPTACATTGSRSSPTSASSRAGAARRTRPRSTASGAPRRLPMPRWRESLSCCAARTCRTASSIATRCLSSEAVRAEIRRLCADRGAPADEDIIVAAGGAGATGHEQGTGPLAGFRSSSTSGRATSAPVATPT